MQRRRTLEGQPTRFHRRLAALGTIGQHPDGGVWRLAGSGEDGTARDLVVRWMRASNLAVTVDRVGNIVGVRPGTEDLPPVMSGSHTDSVRAGGVLDGPLGVVAALEVVAALDDAGVSTRRPVAVASFTNEEGVRFQPDMMGSLVYAGGARAEAALEAVDAEGITLGAALEAIGYAGTAEPGFLVPHAFVELHIEQGPVLETAGVTIGAVRDLAAISWTEVRIRGRAGHAGATPMALRADAGHAAAEITCFARHLAVELGGAQVATIGELEVSPGAINVIPGAARLTADLRNTDDAVLDEAERRFDSFVEQLGGRLGVGIETRRLARTRAVHFDVGVAQIIEAAARDLGLSCQVMTSGAGHDAQMMARICPAAMIFVPSVGGRSHCPEEHTSAEHLEAGARVLLETVKRLAG